MGFNPCNCFLKIWESIRTLTPRVEAHLRVCKFIPSHSPTHLGTWNGIPMIHSWPTPLQVLALVASPRLGLQHIQTQSKSWKNNFQTISIFFLTKRKKVGSVKQCMREKNLDKWSILIVLSNKEIENATSSNEEDKYEMPVMTKRDIQKFKETQMMYWICSYLSLPSINTQEF